MKKDPPVTALSLSIYIIISFNRQLEERVNREGYTVAADTVLTSYSDTPYSIKFIIVSVFCGSTFLSLFVFVKNNSI